jgi:hypothetical protein
MQRFPSSDGIEGWLRVSPYSIAMAIIIFTLFTIAIYYIFRLGLNIQTSSERISYGH